ncbi:ATP-dependent RNA helicase CDC28 (nucleomorph) [Cryptomonas paramecium]|uniref:ATP-dependent RNA helicase CDC28 n=1 Tax=Cryptomonas paramaecium TaxID=2898 RepID=F2HI52_9CRYP|nr:ATP-dependent RNA helicase CDC28 [Cryptomonas paramecium]AEA39115.1 ATP-dependent RNA helicase CDC28 [Cryptomonas paramecium]|mmetsp:Transcript_86139/g.229921  ORF Transcript_86139/g.229921 Transcript_86139/m.229921 type:complete len:630 (-) Transcript_86139:1319-3208(-)
MHKFFPIEKYQKYIEIAVKKFDVILIKGEAGCGKTTIIPTILCKKNLSKKMVVSQTKKIAVFNAVSYMSKKMNIQIGQQIGYTVRFEHKSTKKTKIKFVTDGILFKEILENFFLLEYDCIILDEFHERTVYTDFLLASLKQIKKIRTDLKIIIMSASGEYVKIAKFFNSKLGKITIPGRLFTIKIFYTKTHQSNYIFSILAFIIKYYSNKKTSKKGLLVFLPGREEIRLMTKMIKKINSQEMFNLTIISLYSDILAEKNFDLSKNSNTKKKVILATNIAESSVTVPGINVIIDSGLSKQKTTYWKSGTNLFKIYPVSKSEAYQRAGRTGRERKGKCFRMFTFSDFSKFSLYPKPMLEKTDLTSIILQFYASRSIEFLNLDFITTPPIWNIYKALEKLFLLEVITENFKITLSGKLCSIFPLDINLSIIIIESLKNKNKTLFNLVNTAVSVLAADIPLVFEMKSIFSKEDYARIKSLGDHFCYIAFFYKYFKNENTKKQQDSRHKSIKNFLNLVILIKKQIKETSVIIESFFSANLLPYKKKNTDIKNQFKVCFIKGYFLNTSRLLNNTRIYQIISTGLLSEIHPFSLYKISYPKLIIFQEFLVTSKQYIRGILPIRLKWVYLIGKKIFI